MISLQRSLGRPAFFFGSLAESAQLGHQAAVALHRQLSRRDEAPDLTGVAEARRSGKAVINAVREGLVRHFITPMEREDLEAVAQGLYAIPKVMEKCAERHELSWERLREVDFSLVARLLVPATEVVVAMAQALGNRASLAEIKAQEARLSQIEDDASHIVLESTKQLYQPGRDPLTIIIASEILEILQSAFEHCGALGSTMTRVLMKNS